jgi:hypothetical protein
MNGVGTIYSSTDNRYQNTNILTYDNTFGVHHITFTGVVEDIFSTSVGSSMRGQDFLVDQLGYDNMDGAKSVSIDSWHSERALLSIYGSCQLRAYGQIPYNIKLQGRRIISFR